jgi:hypothetical protein
MSIECVYRSSHPKVLTVWDEFHEQFQAYGKALNETLEAIRPYEGAVAAVRHYRGIPSFSAFRLGDRDQAPEGWRIDREGDLVPDKRTKHGKAVAEDLRRHDQARPKPIELPGLLGDWGGDIVRDGRWYSCGITRIEGAIWVSWSVPLRDGEIDLTMWEPAKLSVFYAAKGE